MTRIIDAPEALKLLAEVVADKGEDYIYPSWTEACVYTTEDGEPSCIVGHVIAAVSPEALHEVYVKEHMVSEVYNEDTGEYDPLDAPATRESLGEGVDSFGVMELNLNVSDLTLTTEAEHVLNAAQAVQDRGRQWGEALAAANLAALDTTLAAA